MLAPQAMRAMIGVAISLDVGATILTKKILDSATEFFVRHSYWTETETECCICWSELAERHVSENVTVPVVFMTTL